LSFRQGLYIGGKYYFKALLSAFTSIYTKPCTLAKERGFIGAISGIYVGIAGMILKPIVATYDFAIALIMGTKNSPKFRNIMDHRTRYPRYLKPG